MKQDVDEGLPAGERFFPQSAVDCIRKHIHGFITHRDTHDSEIVTFLIFNYFL